MKKIRCSSWKRTMCLCVTCALLLAAPLSLADNVMEDRPKSYSIAVTFAQMGQYHDAIERFASLKAGKAYEDSAFWYDYCDAMIKIEEADEYQVQGYRSDAVAKLSEAKTLFFALQTKDFQDSQNMYDYCEARIYYLTDYIQSALDRFSKLYGVRDAWDYYTMLKAGAVLPTQAPVKENTAPLERIQAKVIKRLDVYCGPDSDFASLRSMTVNSNTELYICGRCETDGTQWFLIEVHTDAGNVRCWVRDNGYIYSTEEKQIAKVRTSSRKTTLKSKAEAKYGPGDQYADYSLTIPQGANVTAYDAEGDYTMVDLTNPETGEKMCCWIITNCLR